MFLGHNKNRFFFLVYVSLKKIKRAYPTVMKFVKSPDRYEILDVKFLFKEEILN